MNCASSCIIVAIGGHDCFTNRHLVNSLITLALYQTITFLKAFEDIKLNVARMRISLFDRVKSIVGKGENHGYQHLFLFPQYFPKLSSFGPLKLENLW